MKAKEKMSKSTSKKRITKLLAALTAAVMFTLIAPCAALADDEVIDFDTTSYNVKINLQQDNTAYITENIGVDIHSPMHGIYRYIPLTQEVTYKDDDGNVLKKGTASIKISDVSVTSDKYKVSTQPGNKVIRIGDEDKTVDGEKEYELSYKVSFYDDGLEDYDSFYYNVLPFDWETPIDSSTIKVVMPKKVKKSNIDVIVGNGADNEMIDWDLEGDTIVIKSKGQLPTGTGITVGVKLPEGYFTGEMTHRYTDIIMMALAILAALAMMIIWFKNGRDPKTIQTVEFEAPEGITPADAGYIIDGTVDKKDVVSLLFYFAENGYIAIEEAGKNDFIIHRLVGELPPTAKTYETVFFEGLFEGGQSVRMGDLKETFYDTYEATRDMVAAGFKKRKDRIFPSSMSWTRLVTFAVSTLAFIGIGFTAFRSYQSTMLVVLLVASFLLTLIASVKGVRVQDRKYTKSKFGRVFHSLISLALLAGAGALMFPVSNMTGFELFMKIALCALVAATYFAMRYMQSRTKYGAEMLGKLLGFKEFINIAERDRLEMMLDQNPQYYFDVLPYAYVFGLEKKWAKKFEEIAVEQPDWYYGRATTGDVMFNTWVFYNMTNSFSRNAAASIRIPSDSGAGGSFGGGGFSGGGGFGGGGGGGW